MRIGLGFDVCKCGNCGDCRMQKLERGMAYLNQALRDSQDREEKCMTRIDLLQSKLDWQTEMIERAKDSVEFAARRDVDPKHEKWLTDFKKGYLR